MVLLEKPKDLEELFLLLRRNGYEIKQGKYPAVKGKGLKRFIRLSSLGEGYTADELKKRMHQREAIPKNML